MAFKRQTHDEKPKVKTIKFSTSKSINKKSAKNSRWRDPDTIAILKDVNFVKSIFRGRSQLERGEVLSFEEVTGESL